MKVILLVWCRVSKLVILLVWPSSIHQLLAFLIGMHATKNVYAPIGTRDPYACCISLRRENALEDDLYIHTD